MLALGTVLQRCRFYNSESAAVAAICQSALLSQALKIFHLDIYHKPEAARAHYKKGNVHNMMGHKEAAKEELDTALDMFNTIVPPEDRVGGIGVLDDEDFDHWIMFLSR